MPADQAAAFFEEQGYWIAEGILSPEELEGCRAEIDRLHHLARDLEEKKAAEFRHFQREPYAKDARQEDLPVLRKIEQTGEFSDLFGNLARHPRLIEVVKALLGPDLLLFRSTLMLKPAFHGSAHAFHQDSAYWPMEPPTLVTVSIALTDSTPENGCIQVIPGSHTMGLKEWGLIASDRPEATANRSDLDTTGLIDAPLKAGTALMFHSMTVHGSGPNRSDQPRHTALYAYLPPTVRYTPGAKAERSRTFPVAAGLDGRETLTLTAEPGTEAQDGG